MTQNTSPFSSLRLAQNFGETLGVKKVLSTVQVGKPGKDRFFRAHKSPDMVFPAMLLENKTTSETFLVSAPIANILGGPSSPSRIESCGRPPRQSIFNTSSAPRLKRQPQSLASVAG